MCPDVASPTARIVQNDVVQTKCTCLIFFVALVIR